MFVKTKAIVLSSLKYQEKSLIVKCFTFSDGLITYYVPNAFSTRKGAPKSAYFQPMTLLEIEAGHRNKGTMESLREIRIDYPYAHLHSDITKSTILLFISEMLSHSIQEHERNEALFSFLEAALQWFDHHPDNANFHLILLLEMSKHLGFYPDLSNEGKHFDMKNGRFVSTPDADTLPEQDTGLVRRLGSLQFESTEKSFSGAERRQLLNIVISYYAMHLEGFRRPKSIDILKEVFM